MYETGEHVPGLEMHDRGDEIESIGGEKSNDNLLEGLVVLEELWEVFPTVEGVWDGEVDGVGSTPCRDNIA